VTPRPIDTGPEETPPGSVAGGKGLRLSGAAIASGGGIAALLTFMAQNTEDVRVSFLVWHFTLSVWLLILASALVGAVVWIGLGVLRRHRRRSERREARRD
jgi:uncharacterized integral membrane protein